MKKLDTGRSSAGWSSYGCFRKCPRKYAYENRPALAGPCPRSTGGPRALGTFVHDLLARYYLHRKGEGPDPRSLTDAEVEAIAIESGMDLQDKDAAQLLASNYSRFGLYMGTHAMDGWEPLAVEVEHKIGFIERDGQMVTVPHGTPGSVPYTSRIDLVARDAQGRVWAIDHKTAARIWPTTILAYGLSGQMHGLWHMGWHHYGTDFAGVMLNFFQTKGEIKFERKRPGAAPKMVEEFPRLVWNTAKEIAMWDRFNSLEAWPTSNNESVCVSKYGACDHAHRCQFGS